jgi:hypothetical protein
MDLHSRKRKQTKKALFPAGFLILTGMPTASGTSIYEEQTVSRLIAMPF